VSASCFYVTQGLLANSRSQVASHVSCHPGLYIHNSSFFKKFYVHSRLLPAALRILLDSYGRFGNVLAEWDPCVNSK
jgi:hypothetical protein